MVIIQVNFIVTQVILVYWDETIIIRLITVKIQLRNACNSAANCIYFKVTFKFLFHLCFNIH